MDWCLVTYYEHRASVNVPYDEIRQYQCGTKALRGKILLVYPNIERNTTLCNHVVLGGQRKHLYTVFD